MELHDICDGCGRHPGVCMCSCSIGPEGIAVGRPNPVKMADKLRIIAADAHQRENATKTKSVVEQIKYQAQQAAKSGRLNMQVWFSEFNLNREQAELIARDLERDGFHCTISNEITAMYSNTDWDAEDLLVVSWA